jgi:methylated-DNA-[protein]-cysteine S-methyltransferase
MFFDCMTTPLGQISLLADEYGLRQLTLSVYHPFEPSREWQHDPRALHRYKTQLFEYLSGQRTEFSLPLCPEGSPFQCRLWQQIQQIPYGDTCTYRELAAALGEPHMLSAVSMACNMNPIPIIIPCHRVLNEHHQVGDYRYGAELKHALLALEQGEPLEGPA